ncbi:hypothetical protein [Parahaliea mediterranea]|uniref:Uncharacterized protein n=1 Tax=Parahaliea mediterranea TaxID=651086 RepID=A0A939DDW1_9GAMM|nr:hypothetical protein [Parahaliea mediterranea]MBN7796294.1 hypothetical protein [Parahaliea mediterranea]
MDAEQATEKFREDSFVHVLIGDVIRSSDILSKEDSDYQRRLTVRAIFAAIEGLFTVAKSGMTSLPLNPAEASVLKEESYEVGERGNIRIRTKYIPLERNLKAIVRIVRRVRPAYELDFNHPGWSSLVRALEVRHRLMHPKRLEDLSVSDSEMVDAQRGFNWFLAFTIEVMEETNSTLQEIYSKVLPRPRKKANGEDVT